MITSDLLLAIGYAAFIVCSILLIKELRITKLRDNNGKNTGFRIEKKNKVLK